MAGCSDPLKNSKYETQLNLLWLMPNESARWAGAYPSVLRELGSLGFDVSMAGYYNIAYLGDRFNPNLVDKVANAVLPSFNPKAKLNPLISRLDLAEVYRLGKFLLDARVDIVITTAYFPGLHQACDRAGTRTILWSVDDTSTHCPVWFEYASKFDYVFTYSKGSVKTYKERVGTCVEWLPQAIDPLFFYPRDLPAEHDFSFVGNNLADRAASTREILIPLMNRYPNFHLFGGGWGTGLPAKIHGPVDWRTIPRIYSSSKIVVNIHRDQHKLIEGTINTRVFEALGCQSFLLCDNPLGLEELFEDKKDLAIARSSKEALELAEFYLDRPEERLKIAKSGYSKVINNHTTRDRAATIAAVCSAL